jgi:hypothetical protein
MGRTYIQDMRFEVLRAVVIQVEFFWIVTPCNVVIGYHSEDRSSMNT